MSGEQGVVSEMLTCSECNGTGCIESFDEFRRWSDGFAAIEDCRACQGTGHIEPQGGPL